MSIKIVLIISVISLIAFVDCAEAQSVTPIYQNNRAPLIGKPYVELPLGAIKAQGWLLEMLKSQKLGATGQMDRLYPLVMGARNGWTGGDGDQWERGPYWIDGLLPLAYILDDDQLKTKVQPWIEWTLKSQREDGFFGPEKDFPNEGGIQRKNAQDWWPRMVMIKVLQQYYSATQDTRIVDFMTKYFHYQLKTLPTKPLGHWTYWAKYRNGDNLQAVYWLYNITGDKSLLELGELLHNQGHNFVSMFLESNDLSRINTIHCVNLAQGIKEPVIFYQQHAQSKYLNAVNKAFRDIKLYNGQAQGMYGGDEALHGSDPTKGVELCAIVEMMYSLEKMIEVTGDLSYVDHLERIAFNALPTQITDDFMYHQYYQQANQVKVSRQRHNFDQDHGGTNLLFGVLTGYPCCASNMHQGWPKFTQNLWYATPDNGIAALVFSPSTVTAKVGQGVEIEIDEQTHYPMDNKIKFTITIKDKKVKRTDFPLHIRIPSWTHNAPILLNGKLLKKIVTGGKVEIINRTWESGDCIEVEMPMLITTEKWHENSVSIQRGPLVYALKMNEAWTKRDLDTKNPVEQCRYAYEVSSDSPWNYAFVDFYKRNPNEIFTVEIDSEKLAASYPWRVENAPIVIKGNAKRLPFWQMYNNAAGPIPYSPTYDKSLNSVPVETIELIPYGCTTLRVSQFPVIR